jgi:hypothetical protein
MGEEGIQTPVPPPLVSNERTKAKNLKNIIKQIGKLFENILIF